MKKNVNTTLTKGKSARRKWKSDVGDGGAPFQDRWKKSTEQTRGPKLTRREKNWHSKARNIISYLTHVILVMIFQRFQMINHRTVNSSPLSCEKLITDTLVIMVRPKLERITSKWNQQSCTLSWMCPLNGIELYWLCFRTFLIGYILEWRKEHIINY